MSVVQDKYREDHLAGQAGQLANTQTCDIDSYEVSGTRDDDGTAPDSTKIPFGRAVSFVAGEGNKIARGYVSTRFAGISVKDETLQPRQEDNYEPGDVASVLWRGDIFVPVDAIVRKGDNVSINTSTGQFGVPSDSGSIASIAEDTAGAGYREGTTARVTSSVDGSPTREAVITVTIAAGVPTLTLDDGGAGYSGTLNVVITQADDGGAAPTTPAAWTPTAGAGSAIANMRYESDAEANGVAVVRLQGVVPATT